MHRRFRFLRAVHRREIVGSDWEIGGWSGGASVPATTPEEEECKG